MNDVRKLSSCRLCKNKNLKKALSLGSSPLANSFLTKKLLDQPESFFPLEINFCPRCGHLQLGHAVSPDLLFKNYLYVSSTSNVFIKHFEDYAKSVYDKFKLNKKSLVIDVGSNDGVLLKPFKKLGTKILGIDPAEEIAKKATKEGIKTLPIYFDKKTAAQIAKDYGYADVVTANNVFAHVYDIDEVTGAVYLLLKKNGVFVIEVPYLVDFLQKNLFDTIYHEHLSYFSLKPLVVFFEKHGMKIFDVEKVDSHGGSIRIFVKKKEGKYKINASVKKFIKGEEKLGLFLFKTYVEFRNKIKKNKVKLIKILNELKSQGKTIVGYGAPAKGNTLLNYFGIGNDILDYIVDDSPLKQNLYTPGTHIPVVSSDRLEKSKPDYILILAWNFAEPIMEKLSYLKETGSRFILPAPVPQIVDDKVSVAKRIIDEDLAKIVLGIENDAKKLEGKTVVISGGSGFLGSYINKAIYELNKKVLKKKCKVISIDNYITGSDKNNFLEKIEDENFDFVYHDIRLPILIKEKVDYIIHAAGLASPYYYQKFPLETIESATVGAKNLLELARMKKVKGFFFFSSSEIYGDPDPKHVPTKEDYAGHVSSVGPRACYDESKRLTETLCLVYYQQFGVPIKVVRPFNVYGPGMKVKDYRVIPTFISKGITDKFLPVHGSGNQTRTFCYISDAITGFFKVLLSGRPGEVYNVGNEKPEITMLQLAKLLTKVLNNGANVKTIGYPNSYPAGEPQRRCPDLTKIRTELNYNPEIELEKGLIRTVEWFKSKYKL